MGIQKIFCIFNPIIKLFPNSLRSGWSNLCLEWREVDKRGPRTTRLLPQSGPHIQLSNGHPNMISCLEIKNLPFQKSPWSKWAKNYLNVASTGEPTCISQMGMKEFFFFLIFKPIIPLFLNTLLSGSVKLGTKMTRSREKRVPRTTCLRSQLGRLLGLSSGYPNMISYLKWRILIFKNHLDSELSRINPKTIWV